MRFWTERFRSLLVGVIGLSCLYWSPDYNWAALVVACSLGWLTGDRLSAVAREYIERHDERRMAREYVTTGPGRPMGDQERADLEAWLLKRRNERGTP